jgi:hypothetical protein
MALFATLGSFISLRAQNTEGTVLGTVKDPSGAVVAGAMVRLRNQGTGVEQTATTDVNGDYRFTNAQVGSYVLSIEAKGFQNEQFSQFDLLARETRRLDVALKVGTQAESVSVQASEVPDIQTDTSVIAETKTGRELVDLPVAIGTRAQGSTSPISTLTTQPGVQTDASGNISVAGGNPSQLSLSIDGISTMGAKASEQLSPGIDPGIFEMFPSFYAIEEIRISEQIGPAEYGGVADITTVTKSGTNSYHGGLFENFQNSDLNAANTFTHTTPTIKMNNFGIYMGGPLSIPGLYDGHNKTFFFGSYEALRRPDQTIEIQSVPSVAMRSGDLTSLGGPIVPASQISPLSQKMLQYLFPLPNYGPPGATSNNLAAVFQTPVNVSQADMRIDQQITDKQSVNFHVTYKNRRVEAPSNGSASLGSFSLPEIDYAYIGAYTYVISPTVVNELKGGFTGNHYSNGFGVTAAQMASELGLGPGFSIPPGDAVPLVSILGYQPTEQFFGTYSADGNNKNRQLLDTLTWNKGRHTFKFGADYRYLSALYQNAYAQSRLGEYSFNGSVTSALLTNGATPAYEPFEAFLLGYPDNTSLASIRQPNNEFYSWSDAFFAQDDWKVNSHLTINYGLRWEYHPMFRDHLNNIEAVDPNYYSTVNGQVEHGAVIVPNQESLQNVVNPDFVASIYPVPVLTAAQVGYPEALRYSSKTDFSPRIGIAWKPFNTNRTVIRGGYGRFIEAQLAALADDGGVGASVDDGFFFNSIVNGKPQYTFPYPFPTPLAVPNSQVIGFLLFPHWQDPTIHEWDVTLEQDLGKGIGLRLSYDGNHSSDVGALASVDRVQPNTVGYAAVASQSPYNGEFPDVWARVDTETTNYNAITTAIQKRFSGGLQFQASYIYARNLSDAGGYDPTGAGSEMGGFLTNINNPMYDYGNTAYTHRHRFLATFLYELPYGKGRRFGSNSNKVVDSVLGGWQVSGVVIAQSGSYLTILAPGDPSGTGFNILNGDGRADTVPGVSPYAGQSLNQWINPAAFAVPANNIGRFGDSQVGSVLGPKETVVSLSLFKHIAITERIRVEIGGAAANLFNHPNYANPALLDLASVGSGFGQISNLLNVEGAGPRSLQLTGRITF